MMFMDPFSQKLFIILVVDLLQQANASLLKYLLLFFKHSKLVLFSSFTCQLLNFKQLELLFHFSQYYRGILRYKNH